MDKADLDLLYSFCPPTIHQPRDIFLFDNVLYGHMRMPGAPPRKLHALFAEEIDSRSLRQVTSHSLTSHSLTSRV